MLSLHCPAGKDRYVYQGEDQWACTKCHRTFRVEWNDEIEADEGFPAFSGTHVTLCDGCASADPKENLERDQPEY